MAEVNAWTGCCFHCEVARSGLYALGRSGSRVSCSVSSSNARTKASGEAGDMGKDVKVSGSGLGDVGGEESEMDLWDAVSLSSKDSSSSARGFGFSVMGFLEREKCSSAMVSQRQAEVMVMAVRKHQLVSSILAVVSLAPPPLDLHNRRRLPASVLSLFLSFY